jgi:flagellar biosynthetic protein FliR
MAVGIDTVWVAAVFLVALRLGPLFVLAPVFGGTAVPVRLRVFLALAFATMLASLINVQAASIPASPGGFLGAAAAELFVGIALVFGLFAAFGAFLLGGRLLDFQIGFGIANLIDPATRSHAPLLGTALNLLALAVFLAVDGHHMIIRGFAWSLEHFPPGRPLAELDPSAVAAQFGVMFAYGLVIVAPAVFALLLLDVALAVVARTMPQMNIFIVAMPLKVFVGLLMLALSVRYMLPAMRKIFDSVPLYWERLLA